MEYVLAIASLAVAVAAMYLGYTFYVKNTSLPGKVAASLKGLYTASYNKFWVDEAYGVFPVGFTIWLAKASQMTDAKAVDGAVNGTGWLAREGSVGSGWIDRRIVDGFVNLVGTVLYAGSLLLRALQTGLFQNYALAIVLGLFALFVAFGWRAIAGFFGGGQ
jgi:NADH-quinone oxidoreductase subunit L